ncbi:hypothetical protein EZV62_012003 [Acer yangbiense]|uniref:Flavin-containing monooxygenase n=1 Tax=Acer yangbiense TaxID=1000413 RepID=A0A5C7I8C4_9ROSI|nr:hypothetical protein EZV62_012003 [Acer yangbiense]
MSILFLCDIDWTTNYVHVFTDQNDMVEWDRYMKRYSGRYYQRSCISALHIWYNDQLCKDMGWNPKRKKGFFAELFEPYGPLDYVTTSVTEDFPTQHQVFDYIQSYAQHFDVLKHIRFNTKVVGIEYDQGLSDEEVRSWSSWNGNAGQPFHDDRKWQVSVDNTLNNSTEVDFVILCVGQFSDVPNIPEFPPKKGPEAFHGKVIHSMDYAAMDYESAANFVKGKLVTVVGLQKSALDIAMECTAANNVMFRRFSELLVHKPGEGFLLNLLATMLSPLRWGFSKFVESDIKKKHRLAKYGMVPRHSFLEDINSCLISTVFEKFYDSVEEGNIILKKSQSFSFCEEVILVDGETTPLKTDLVILATGFRGDKKLKDIFVSQTFQDYIVGSPSETLPLYRLAFTYIEIIKCRIPHEKTCEIPYLKLAEMRVRWLGELLDGAFKVPSIKEMEKDTVEWDLYMKRYSNRYYRRSCIGALHIWYNDQLCKDMGIWDMEPKEKKWNFQ